MTLPQLLREACLLLVVILPCLILANRFKLGAILGFLLAGVIIGPSGLQLVDGASSLSRMTEIGVVLFLFIIGVEFRINETGAMLRKLMLLGVLQVVVTGGAIFAFLSCFALTWQGALVAGFALALSATAIAMQVMKDRGESNSTVGSATLSILLVQEVSVVPLLALIPILNPSSVHPAVLALSGSAVAAVVGAIALIAVAGRFIVPWVIALLDRQKDASSVGAVVALLVLGSAYCSSAVGLPMALGAFLAGISLSRSVAAERVTQLVRPHQILFLALFFVSVGLAVNLGAIKDSVWHLIVLLPAVLAIKIGCLWALARLVGLSSVIAVRTALILSQAGEFGFLVIASCYAAGWCSAEETSAATVLVTLTMLATPLLQRFATGSSQSSATAAA